MQKAKENNAVLDAPEQMQVSDFESLLLQEIKPKTEGVNAVVKSAVKTLAEQALDKVNLVSSDTISTIEMLISELDKKISQQLNQVIHHKDFQELESSWRGLHFLVNNTEMDESLKIKVFNISKKELLKVLKKYKGTSWDQSPIFKKIYEHEYGTPGGEPYGMIVGDFYFDNTPPDIEILRGISKIASAAHTPFLSSASPSMLNMNTWQELSNPRDITKIFTTEEYAGWRSFRESEDSRYVALVLPRVLSRLPYGPESNPVDTFDFVEETACGDSSKYSWMNAAYAFASNVNRAFKDYSWCAKIRGVESGGTVSGLPLHTFPTDEGGISAKCPTEIAITDRREAELSKNGFLPLCHWKNTDFAVFIGGQTVNKPQMYESADATANANLSARLPYMFAVCRFAHFLKCIVRDKVGSFKERADMEKWLNSWIANYVTSDPAASEETKAKFPLAEAHVKVESIEENPGYYTAKFYLRPHFQLEGLTTSLRLVTKVPNGKE